MLYVAPETLTKERTIELLHRIKVSFLAIDEAHCISEWGTRLQAGIQENKCGHSGT